MKKIISLLLTVIAVLTLSACEATPSTSDEGQLTATTIPETATTTTTAATASATVVTATTTSTTITPSTETTTVAVTTAPPPQTAPEQPKPAPPLYQSFWFDSIEDLINGVSGEFITEASGHNYSKKEVIDFYDEQSRIAGHRTQGLFEKGLFDIEKGNFYVPYYEGKEMKYRNREGEGFSNILLSGWDGRSAISHYPDMGKSGVVFVNIVPIEDNMRNEAKEKNISEFLKEFKPDNTNIHNYQENEVFSDAYISEILLSGRKVEALILVSKRTNRVSIYFVYDDIQVSIVNADEKLAYEWMKDLSFEKYRG